MDGFVEKLKLLSTTSKAKYIVIIVVVILIGILGAYLVISLWWKSKELGKLRFEVDRLNAEKKKLAVDARISENEKKAEDLGVKIKNIDKAIDNKNVVITAIENSKSITSEEIRRLVTWEDVDKYLASKLKR